MEKPTRRHATVDKTGRGEAQSKVAEAVESKAGNLGPKLHHSMLTQFPTTYEYDSSTGNVKVMAMSTKQLALHTHQATRSYSLIRYATSTAML